MIGSLQNVTPVFKKGQKSSPVNYRPISLTVNLCNVLESLTRNEMINYLEVHVLINDTQRGFVINKACLMNSLVFM